MIEARNLTRRYGRTVAVDALSFVLHRSRHRLDIFEDRVESGDRGRHLAFFDRVDHLHQPTEDHEGGGERTEDGQPLEQADRGDHAKK